MIKQMMLLMVLVVVSLGTGCASTGGARSMYDSNKSSHPAWIYIHSSSVYFTDNGEQGVRVTMESDSTDDSAVRMCMTAAHDHMCLAADKVEECGQGQRFRVKLVGVRVVEDLWAASAKRMQCLVALDYPRK